VLLDEDEAPGAFETQFAQSEDTHLDPLEVTGRPPNLVLASYRQEI